MDFTLSTYKSLLESILAKGYNFQTFESYLKNTLQLSVILRHDVDLLPYNSLKTAQIENKLGIRGTYYFRVVNESYDENIIKEIYTLGHEIGYHYESLTTCLGNYDKAIEDFKLNLEKFRKIVPITTICMHGSPTSSYDSKDLWKKYNYKDFGIIGEPYFDIDFSSILYLTDTGRMWDGYKVSIRDKIVNYQEDWIKQGLTFHKTEDIINAVNLGNVPKRIMFTFHPQRWHYKAIPWVKELVLQNLKNQVKRFLINRKV